MTGLCQLQLDGDGEAGYDLFSDLEDCFVAALEQALSEAAAFAREAYRSEFSWREGIRSALWRLLALMERNPRVARLLVVESLAVGPAVSVRRARVFSDLTELIDAVRAQPGRVREPPALTAEAVVGGACSVLHSRLIAEREPPLTGLLGPLMSMIVLPYLGTAAAQRELDRPTPQAPLADSPVVASDAHALESLDIRLTYRTVRVLSAIAEHPGARNCEVAQAADIVDQGQVSKLLTRLSGLNLIENVAGANDRTGPKAWHLTGLGAQLERAAGHQAKLAAGVSDHVGSPGGR
jgi:AcrR family transcriptional regulator